MKIKGSGLEEEVHRQEKRNILDREKRERRKSVSPLKKGFDAQAHQVKRWPGGYDFLGTYYNELLDRR